MICVYILKVKNGTKYIGSTNNLERRIKEHRNGEVGYTKPRRPVVLYAYRQFDDIKEAARWEKKYKRSSGQLARDFERGLFNFFSRSVHNASTAAEQRTEN